MDSHSFQQIFASNFGRLYPNDGLDEYLRWAIKKDPDLLRKTMEVLGETWDDNYGKPSLPRLKKAYQYQLLCIKQRKRAKTIECRHCGDKGYGYTILEERNDKIYVHTKDTKAAAVNLSYRKHPCMCGRGWGFFNDLIPPKDPTAPERDYEIRQRKMKSGWKCLFSTEEEAQKYINDRS